MDLDILTEDLTASTREKAEPAEIKIKLTPPAQEKQPEKAKPKPPKKAVAPQAKPAPKAQKPKKAEVKPEPKKADIKPEPAKEKYEVKENDTEDAHDKLKPRANPVPVVKVIPVEPEIPEPVKPTAVPVEPKLSKHFLEQQQTVKETPKVLEVIRDAVDEPEPLAEQPPEPAPQMLLSSKPADLPVKTAEALKWSVFPVVAKLTPKERSAFLVKEVPADSATAKAVLKNKDLASIFVFENNSANLTEEMLQELENQAKTIRKDRSLRVLLLSYSGPTAPEYGKERQLSLRRALMVRSAMARLGIGSLRIEIRSQGTKGAGEKLPNRVDLLIDDK